MKRNHLICFFFIALFMACSGGNSTKDIPSQLDTTGKDDAKDVVQPEDTKTADIPASSDLLTDQSQSKDSVATDEKQPVDTQQEDTIGGEDVASDKTAADSTQTVDPCNGVATKGTKAIGMPCTSHEECETGFCYDEAWCKDGPCYKDTDMTTIVSNLGFRFCTVACTGQCSKSCNEWTTTTYDENKCYIFLPADIANYDLSFKSLCFPACYDDAECKTISGGTLTKCRLPVDWAESQWAFKTCFP